MPLVSKSDEGVLAHRSSLDIRNSQGVGVRFFRELLIHLAELAVANPEHAILLRGQRHDYREAELTTIKPSVFRNGGAPISEAEALLARAMELLSVEAHRCGMNDLVDAIERTPTIAHAILQHYEVVPTPWLDLTDMPQMAYYFSTLHGRSSDLPVIYAFAIPRPQLNFSRELRTGLLCQSLSSFCPAYARRPHFQRAFGLAEISRFDTNPPQLEFFSQDLSPYLLCKFIPFRSEFEGELRAFFGALEGRAAFPPDEIDPMRAVCRRVVDLLT